MGIQDLLKTAQGASAPAAPAGGSSVAKTTSAPAPTATATSGIGKLLASATTAAPAPVYNFKINTPTTEPKMPLLATIKQSQLSPSIATGAKSSTPQVYVPPAPSTRVDVATKNPIIAKITGGTTIGSFLADALESVPEASKQVSGAINNFLINKPAALLNKYDSQDVNFLVDAGDNHADTASGKLSNFTQEVFHKFSYGTQTLSGLTGGMYQPPQEATHDIVDQTLSGLSQGLGTVVGIGEISAGLQAFRAPTAIAAFIDANPLLAKYGVPLLKNGIAFSAYGQLNPNLTSVTDRLKKFGEDMAMSVPYTALGGINSAKVSIPASFGAGYVFGRLQGQSNKDALVSGFVFGALDAAGRAGHEGEGFVNGRASDQNIKKAAIEVLNTHADTKLTTESSPEEILTAYKKAAAKVHPEAGGDMKDMISVQTAHDYLLKKGNTLAGDTPPEDIEQTNIAEAAKRMAQGQTDVEIEHELSQVVPTEKAKEIIAKAKEYVPAATEATQKAQTTSTAPQAEAVPQPQSGEPGTPSLPPVDGSILDSTPADIVNGLAQNETTHQQAVAPLQDRIAELQSAVEKAKPQSQEKKDLKIQLANAKAELATALDTHNTAVQEHGQSFRDVVSAHMADELQTNLHGEALQRALRDVSDHVTNPDKLSTRAMDTIRQIVEDVHASHSAEAAKPIAEIEKTVSDIYKAVGKDVANEALSNIEVQMLDLSVAGRKIFYEDGTVGGQSSTFPKYIPEELRSSKLFEKVMKGLDAENIKYPTKGNATRQRALYDSVLNELDAQLGVDTSKERSAIIDKYGTQNDNKGSATEEASSGASGSKGPTAEAQKGTGSEAKSKVSGPKSASVDMLSTLTENSLEKNASGQREKSLEYFRNNPDEITKEPVRLREADGKVHIEDGRHRVEAAREQGIKNLKFEDVTNQYPEKQGEVGKDSKIVADFANPEADTGKTKLGQSVAENAVARGIEAKIEGTSLYGKINIEDQANRAQEIVDTDYEKAKRIAFGHENAEGDLNNIAVFTAVEQKAILDGDGQTLLDLANSSVGSELSKAAQTMRLAQERYPEDPVTAIKDIQDAREKAGKRKYKKPEEAKTKEKAAIKEKQKKAAPTKQTWSDFIESIKC